MLVQSAATAWERERPALIDQRAGLPRSQGGPDACAVWRLNPLSALHYRHWGHEWVVFDAGSGQTHEMDSVAAVALMHCENGWTGLDALLAGISADLELPPDAGLAQRLQHLLDQFTALDLLECRAP